MGETLKVLKVKGPRNAGKGKAWDIVFDGNHADGDTMSEKAAKILEGLVGSEAQFEFEQRQRGNNTYYTVERIISTNGESLYDRNAGGGNFGGRNTGGGGEPKDETWIAVEVAAKEAGETVRAWLHGHVERAEEIPTAEELMDKIAAGIPKIAAGIVQGRAGLLGAQPVTTAPVQANGAQAPAAANGKGKDPDPAKVKLDLLWAHAVANGPWASKGEVLKAYNAFHKGSFSTNQVTAEGLQALLANAGVAA